MTGIKNEAPIETLPLLQQLDELLLPLLRSLSDEEWQAPTVAKKWCVKDVAAHLLDGNLRGLSTGRDGFFGENPGTQPSYTALVAYLNELNMSWTRANRRLSPQVLIALLESSGRDYIAHLRSLHPLEPAVFSVAWAGQDVSPNWFHIAREYTEKFLHQQQIRDAVNKPGIMTRPFFYPYLATLMHALPHTFRTMSAPASTVVTVEVTSAIGGTWSIIKTVDGWKSEPSLTNAAAKLTLEPEVAWKLFSKSWSPEQVRSRVVLEGDTELAAHALKMVAVMA
jgi:uncharacterized protein (TIGR03083 family)